MQCALSRDGYDLSPVAGVPAKQGRSSASVMWRGSFDEREGLVTGSAETKSAMMHSIAPLIHAHSCMTL